MKKQCTVYIYTKQRVTAKIIIIVIITINKKKVIIFYNFDLKIWKKKV